MPAVFSRTLILLLDARLVLYKTYLKLDNQVKSMVREDSVCQRLMTRLALNVLEPLLHILA